MLAGALFSLTAEKGERSVLARRSFWLGLVEALIITGLAVFFFVLKPEWMWMYSLHEKEVPAWLGPSLFCLYPFPYVASYFIGLDLKKAKDGYAWVWAGAVALVALIMHLLILNRWTSWVTTDEFIAGMRGGFFTTPLWIYLFASILIAGLSAAAFLYLSFERAAEN
ncbi:MAG: hypothetical protein A2V67_14845 [Deltaproteobacteria bacterium RBG_13_61_14]|nr:MAG: hypothetical protein A2V67_14845 [Deltaproteobacteria bacterium RBG_13_61_14]